MFPKSVPADADNELSALLARGLAFTNGNTSQPAATAEPPTATQSTIKYSITQHYHHSTHVVPLAQPSGPQCLALKLTQMDETTANIILSRNGVEPSALFPSQLTLFRQVDLAQQMCLIETWRSWPLARGSQAYCLESQQASTSDSLSHEQQDMDAMDRDDAESVCGHSTYRSSSPKSLSTALGRSTDRGSSAHLAEPYMVLGHNVLTQRNCELLAQQNRDSYSLLGSVVGGRSQALDSYRPATDPVYQQTDDTWHTSARLAEGNDAATNHGDDDEMS
ncbi:MAG: hypothetical protein M1815_002058 [Lichina confinis]|nr:MAG: hypothetical protein M1815_002058 [Lichina confinis]